MQPNDGFAWVQAPPGPALVCRPLEAVAQHLYTTRQWRLGTPAADIEDAWAEVARAAGVDTARLVRVRQVHGAAVVRVEPGVALPPPTAEADIIVSRDPSVALAIQTADCVPILLADPRSGAVAAAHAGWRGLSARVPAVAVARLRRDFDANPSEIVAAAGPSISADRYEVGADVYHCFADSGFDRRALNRWFGRGRRADHWQFDGWSAARDQLLEAGLRPDRIHVAGLCTAANADWFCSYRRDGSPAGRMAAVIRPRADGARG